MDVPDNMAVLGTSSGSYAKIWNGEAERTTDVSWLHHHLVHMPHCTPMNKCAADNKHCKAAWLPGLKYFKLVGLLHLASLLG